jgi:hypothetical protein
LECGDLSPLWISFGMPGEEAGVVALATTERESGDKSPHSKKCAHNSSTCQDSNVVCVSAPRWDGRESAV